MYELAFRTFGKKWWWTQLTVYFFYLFSHLLFLTALPVFADESIYIRWSQLIIDDWQRYLFFALNDGKTPVFIWLVVPFLQIIEDQLFAGRLVAVLAGAIQVWVMKELVKALGGEKKGQLIGMVFTIILPMWYFYHRMALMDGLMTLFLSISLLFLIKIVQNVEKQKPFYLSFIGVGISFGLAILTKLPAIFFGSIFVLISVYPFTQKKFSVSLSKIFWVGSAGFIGCLIFLLLKLNPAFGQLFARGQDFTYSLHDILNGEWVKSISNTRIFSTWFLYYFSPFLLFFIGLGLYLRTVRKLTLFLILSTIFFWAPFIILGKVVYPRYLLPSAIFVTLLISLVGEKGLESIRVLKNCTVVCLIGIFCWSIYFMSMAMFYPNSIPFLAVDRLQYLTEWSSGHGVIQAVQFIQEKAKTEKVLVATEGYFGTLPDAVLLNLHNQDVTNIEVWGIGAPVRKLPDNFETKAKLVDTTLLLVNSHRMFVTDPRFHKIASYPRPYGAPTFDIYEFLPYEQN